MASKKDLLKHIDDQGLIGFTRELVRIPSENPPGDERDVALRILDRFKKLGLTTEIVEAEKGRPNVIARLKGTGGGRTLLFNGHTDVVPAGPEWTVDPYAGVIKDGRLYGRGACDMKGGLAAIIAVAEVFQKAGFKPRGDLVYSIVVDEEAGGAKGTGFLVEKGLLQADMALVAEPSDFRMSVSEGGVVWSELLTRGTRTHTINSRREGAVNAVEKMAQVIVALMGLKDDLDRLVHQDFGSPILSINMVNGGLKTNIVPHECRAAVDFRFPPGVGLTPEKAIGRLQGVLEGLKKNDPALEVELKPQIVAHPFIQDEDIEVVGLLKESFKELEGHEPDWWRRGKKTVIPTDDSDVYHLWVKGKIPSIYFGPGKLEQAHATDEYIDLEDIIKAARIYTLFAVKALA